MIIGSIKNATDVERIMNMATLTLEKRTYRPANPLPLLLACFLLAGIIFCAHAVVRHGSEAQAVRNCIDQGGTIQTWFNLSNGREAIVCQLNETTFGIQIIVKGREVTSFIKNKMHNLRQIENYLGNSGFKPSPP